MGVHLVRHLHDRTWLGTCQLRRVSEHVETSMRFIVSVGLLIGTAAMLALGCSGKAVFISNWAGFAAGMAEWELIL